MSKERLNGHLAIFAANVIFGIYIPISKYLMAEYFSGSVLTVVRMWGGAALFWIAGIFVRDVRPSLRDILMLCVFSFFGIVLNLGLFIYGLEQTSPIDASVIITTTPVLVMILAAVFMKDIITGRKAAGALIGGAGAILLVMSSARLGSASATVFGDVMVFLCEVSVAIYFALSKPIVSKYSPVTVSKWMFLFAALVLIPMTPSALTAPDAFKAPVGAEAILLMAFVVLGATFTTYLCIAYSIKRLRPTTLAMYNYVQPFISACAAIAVGQDVFSYEKLFAALLVFAGVYLVTTARPPREIIV